VYTSGSGAGDLRGKFLAARNASIVALDVKTELQKFIAIDKEVLGPTPLLCLVKAGQCVNHVQRGNNFTESGVDFRRGASDCKRPGGWCLLTCPAKHPAEGRGTKNAL
jgi:hypothetical protein